MKKLICLCLLVFTIFGVSFNSMYAETIDDVLNKKKTLETQRNQAIKDLEQKNMTLKEVINQVAETYKQQEVLEKDKNNIQQSINDIEIKIANTQAKIDKLRLQASASLEFYQQVHNTNPLIEQLFSSQVNESDSYEKSYATKTIINAGMDKISEAVLLQQQLNDQEKELNIKKVDLDTQLNEINNKVKEMEILKIKVQNASKEAQEHYDSIQAANVANQRLETLMQVAGCKPGQVYGVDCGQNNVESTGTFLRPVSYGMVTMEFQGYNGPFGLHTGIDIGQNGSGGPVYAAASGQVIAAGNNIVIGGGNQVLIVHNYNGQQVITSYCHMASLCVSEGQIVSANTQIGTVGQTGYASGPHLHFEISYGAYGWNGGQWVNPRQFVNFPRRGDWFNSR